MNSNYSKSHIFVHHVTEAAIIDDVSKILLKQDINLIVVTEYIGMWRFSFIVFLLLIATLFTSPIKQMYSQCEINKI